MKRVWGAKRDATASVVLQTVKQLTKIDPEKRLTVNRKFQEGESDRRDHWWYLIRGSEAALADIENLWNSVSLQVGWKLESCTKPLENDDSTTTASANTNESTKVPNARLSSHCYNIAIP